MFLGLAKAVPVGRGHEHPHGKKKVLRNGPELGRCSDCQITEIPRPSAGCSWPTLPVGFGISRVLGSAGSWQDAANRAAPRQLALSTRVATKGGLV